MPRHVLSIIAATLVGCTTVTRISVTPDQLPGLAGMNPSDERAVTPIGNAGPVTVRGSDELILQTRFGSVPVRTAADPEQGWARIDTLHSNPPELSVLPSTAPGQPQWSKPVQVRAADISSADLKLTRAAPVNTVLLVTGIVLGAVLLVGAIGAVAWSASGGLKLGPGFI